ncbi:uncharacterized protein LOC128667081 [Bombina bombina]|uniref:uncharacterized protein LOC128667081 n=1 Tax=Bombina bombina TaxID=8345 RepID=UPI00235A9D9F|nr:uncharacterized protein LOC128667081 [Bombina bombina]
MGTFSFWLSLSCLVAAGYGETLSCVDLRWLPPNLNQVNGVWNMIAMATDYTFDLMSEINYGYITVSATETQLNITSVFNPLISVFGSIEGASRKTDDKDTLTYVSLEKGIHVATLTQANPDILIITHHVNNRQRTSILYGRGKSLPELDVTNFRAWTGCRGLIDNKVFKNHLDYAKECRNILTISDDLHKMKENVSYHIIAKSSSYPDPYYHKSLLYHAHLVINRNGMSCEIIETITDLLNIDKKKLKYQKDCDVVRFESFKTQENFLLLGIKEKDRRTLYLASKTSKENPSLLKEFEKQSLCFQTDHFYLFPESTEKKQSIPPKACEEMEKELHNITLKQSVGKWGLVVSAFDDLDIALHNIKLDHSWIETKLVDGQPQMIYFEIREGSLSKSLIKGAEEKDGHVEIKDNVRQHVSTMHFFGSNCIFFSAQDTKSTQNALYCRTDPVSNLDIQKFSTYAYCRKTFINVRKHSALACSDVPHEADTLDLEKIAGKWKIVAAASTEANEAITQGIEFKLTNGEVTIIEKAHSFKASIIDNKKLHYMESNGLYMDLTFSEPIGEFTILFYRLTSKETIYETIILATKNFEADVPLDKFKHIVSCLGLNPITLQK